MERLKVTPFLLLALLLLSGACQLATGAPQDRGVKTDTGPDSHDSPSATWNYVMDPNATFSWYDARSGTNMTLQLRNNQGINDRDDGFASAQFKNFTFNFYGVDYTRIYAGSNGYTGFSPSSDYTVSVPGITFPSSDSRFQKLLAPYWDDLDFTSRGAIYFKEFPDEQNPQAVVVEYYRAVHFGNANEVWCELVLMQDGTILFQYKYVRYVQTGIVTGLNDGDGKHYNIYSGLNATTTDVAIAFYRPSTLTVTGTDIAPSQVPQGSSDIHMLKLNARSDRGIITLFGLKVDRTGTLVDSAIDDVRLYHDKDHSGNLSAGDLLLGTKQFVSGSLTFPLSFRVGSSGEDMLVLINLSASAKAGRTFGLLLKDKSYVLTNQMVSETTFPIQTKLVLVLDALPDVLYVSGTNQAPLTIERGRRNVIMLALMLNASSDYVYVSSLNVTRTGNATDADVPDAVLYYDKDRSGGYSGGDVPVSYAKFASGIANFTFTFQIENPTQEILLVGYNVSSAAVLGRTAGEMLASSPGKVTVLSPDSVAPYLSRYSYNSTIVGDVTPPEVQAIQIQPPPPVKEEVISMTVTFNEDMDQSAVPTVTFGLTPPHDQHKVTGSWVTPADWKGTFTVTTTTGDGNNVIRIAGGKDMQGNGMKEDTSTKFFIDTVPPASNASPLPSQTYTSQFPVRYISSDIGTGVRSVELVYRINAGQWLSYGNFTSSPITFNSTGDGTYDFYTVARDLADNEEQAPATPDAKTLMDSTPPSSHVGALNLYYNTTEFDVPFTAWDNGTGLDYVELCYRISGGIWNIFPAKQATSPIKFKGSIDGVYDFYTIGVDKAGHRERPPPAPDAITIVDAHPPDLRVAYPNGNEILVGGTKVNVTWEVQDALGVSGAIKVLFSKDGGATWEPLGSAGGDTFSWDIPPSIDSNLCLIRLEAHDFAMNLATDVSDAFFTIASTMPASTAKPLPKYVNSSDFDVGYTAFDPKGEGIVSVSLHARMTGGQWFDAGVDTGMTGKIRFHSNGDGRYEFYTTAKAGSNRVEDKLPRKEATTTVDTIPPSVKKATPTGEFTGTRANVTIVFSESMDTSTVVLDIVPTHNGTKVWTNDNTTLTWLPKGETPDKMEFTVYGSGPYGGASDLAGNVMKQDFRWKIYPPGPPDPAPIFIIVLLASVFTALLGYVIIRKRTLRCVKCGVRIHSGKYCLKCIPKPDGTEGKIVDGVFIGDPIPPSPKEERALPKTVAPPTPETEAARTEEGEAEPEIEQEPERPAPPDSEEPELPRPQREGEVVVGVLKEVPSATHEPGKAITPRDRLQRIREKRKGGR